MREGKTCASTDMAWWVQRTALGAGPCPWAPASPAVLQVGSSEKRQQRPAGTLWNAELRPHPDQRNRLGHCVSEASLVIKIHIEV